MALSVHKKIQKEAIEELECSKLMIDSFYLLENNKEMTIRLGKILSRTQEVRGCS